MRNSVLSVVFLGFIVLAIGCRRNEPAPSTPFSIQATLVHVGETRTYRVHLPPNYYENTNNLPMVIALHGGGGSGEQFEAQSKLSEKADREGFVVVYPDGLENTGVLKARTWNAGGCCTDATTRNTDDVGFVGKIIDAVAADYRIDTKRVYATGHSNGAMLCYRLACELSGRIAAIAPNAGTMQMKTPCRPSRVLPVIHVHSKLDNHVPYMGGIGSESLQEQNNPSVDSSLTVFSNLAACGVKKQTVTQNSGYTFFRWSACNSTTEIHYYLTEDGGHSWPGGNRTSNRSDVPSTSLTNNDIIWDFFKRHTLP